MPDHLQVAKGTAAKGVPIETTHVVAMVRSLVPGMASIAYTEAVAPVYYGRKQTTRRTRKTMQLYSSHSATLSPLGVL